MTDAYARDEDVRRSELRATIPEDKIARFIVDEVACPFCEASRGTPCRRPTNLTKSGEVGSLRENNDPTNQHVQRVKVAGRLAIHRLVDGVRPIEGLLSASAARVDDDPRRGQ